MTDHLVIYSVGSSNLQANQAIARLAVRVAVLPGAVIFDLLEYLLRNAGRVLTRGQLIDRIWGADYVGDTKTLDVHGPRA